MKRSRLVAPATLALSAALVLSACGSTSEAGSGAGSSSAAAGDCGTATTTTEGIGNDACGVTVEGGFGVKPVITIGDQTKDVTQLQVIDLVEGTGDPVLANARVLADYAGVGASTTKQFDSSFDRGQPSEFGLDEVIFGWTQGIPGMKLGGRRLLIIPGALAYGANPTSPDIEPNEVLVFVVDMVNFINPGETAPAK
ncbi:FKBP-type peptidyl-prolyl cis-trans isomerase [Longivirga aurantiaca]|uniref:Peptidyl-prolyl cis-trans isomerase n=1 Tax=Longivirga aurantiaca TaxID=1837743 RepID=A0ABW1T1D2_9ACTN